jgi:hypothetical protein
VVAKDPTTRSEIASIAAHVSWSRTADPSARTAPARAAARIVHEERWEREVDPDRVLTPDQRARMAEHAKKAYFKQLARRSAEVRRAKSRKTTT